MIRRVPIFTCSLQPGRLRIPLCRRLFLQSSDPVESRWCKLKIPPIRRIISFSLQPPTPASTRLVAAPRASAKQWGKPGETLGCHCQYANNPICLLVLLALLIARVTSSTWLGEVGVRSRWRFTPNSISRMDLRSFVASRTMHDPARLRGISLTGKGLLALGPIGLGLSRVGPSGHESQGPRPSRKGRTGLLQPIHHTGVTIVRSFPKPSRLLDF
jgi:hypothetical protein